MQFVKEHLSVLAPLQGETLPEARELADHFLAKLDDTAVELKADLVKLNEWNQGTLQPTEEDLAAFHSLQRRLTERHHNAKRDAWIASFPKEDLEIRNRVHSIVAPETGRPLNVVTINVENHMWDQDFLYWVRHRLLIPLTPSGHRCVDTDTAIDPDLDHAFCCLKRGRGVMHSFVKNAVNDACKGVARRTGERVTNEPPIAQWLKPDLVNNKNEKTIEGLKLRRADVMIEPELAVASMATKTVTLIDVRHCAMNLPVREEDIGAALREGQKAKETDYKTHFDFPAGVTLLPFCVNAMGQINEDGKKWMEDYCTKAAAGDKRLYNSFITKFRDKVSIGHARGVGCVIRRCVENCFSENQYLAACARGFVRGRR